MYVCVCVWGWGASLSLSVLSMFHVRRGSYHEYAKLNVNHLQRVLSLDDFKKLKEFLSF